MNLEINIRRKAYGEAQEPVLESAGPDDLSFSVTDGKIICLFGPSGSGKSTLLRIIAGVDMDYEGSVKLDGIPVSAPTRNIGLTTQGHAAFDWLTVAGNISFALRYQPGVNGSLWGKLTGRVEPHLVRKEALRLAELVGLAPEHLDKYPEEISGGMKQRMLFARALLPSPKVLLLDEPFSSLDYESRYALQDVVINVRNQLKTAFICVSHDPDETLFIADEILVLGGTPAKIVHRLSPAFRGDSESRFTVEFQEAKRNLHRWLNHASPGER